MVDNNDDKAIVLITKGVGDCMADQENASVKGILKLGTSFHTVIADPPITLVAQAKFILVSALGYAEGSTEDVTYPIVGNSCVVLEDQVPQLMRLPLWHSE
ncbi:MAG: hypothetical protein Q9178_004985 [Gyalolechia marmorata]